MRKKRQVKKNEKKKKRVRKTSEKDHQRYVRHVERMKGNRSRSYEEVTFYKKKKMKRGVKLQ